VDIAAWLNRLGLQQYEQAFRDNDVDAAVLPELTADDLIGLGVTSIGHRRKLLAAIAALGDKPGDHRALTTVPGRAEAPTGSRAERRQLTVMFCDLVGYPQAHEDDAERAIRAGLGIIENVARLDAKSVQLQARIGIAAGLVVVGDLIGEGSAQEQSSSPFASFRSGVSKPSVNQP